MMPLEPTHPFMTLVLPTLNEERYLERCVRSLLDDPFPRERLEIFIVDGGSTDRTVVIAQELIGEFPFLHVLHNPRRLQAAAFNIALREADERAGYVMRCDAHAEYPPGFLSRAAASLEASGAAVATYADAPKARSCFQAAVAFAQNTPLGVGNAWYRLGGVSRFVEHGKHGCFRRAAVEAVGGYDEAFSHNEDSELSLRLIQAGGKVWLDAGLTVSYYPRSTPAALARQYYLYGRGRAQTIRKHRLMPRLRQLAPVVLVLGEAAICAAAPMLPELLLAFPIYAAALIATALYGAVRTGSACVLLSPVAFAVMHHAWGLGFLARLLHPDAIMGTGRPMTSRSAHS
jgi:succinoglycan biosynthesis protein ExoA